MDTFWVWSQETRMCRYGYWMRTRGDGGKPNRWAMGTSSAHRRYIIYSTRSCINVATWRCSKTFSQWERSFHWKLRCHWLKGLRQRLNAVVIQDPVYPKTNLTLVLFRKPIFIWIFLSEMLLVMNRTAFLWRLFVYSPCLHPCQSSLPSGYTT